MTERLELRERILDCTACELHSTSCGPVPFSGPAPASFAIVGEAPGAEEDKGGQPFVGRSGQLLRKYLVDAGLEPDQAFICNTVSCFPHGTPSPASIAACRQNLRDQLDFARVSTILTLGSVALGAFRPDLRMTAAHGQTFALPDGRTVFSTYHPAAALRRADWDEALSTDLLRFGRAIKQGSWVGLTIELCASCRIPEDGMEEIFFDNAGLPYCQKCWPASPGGRAEAGKPVPVVGPPALVEPAHIPLTERQAVNLIQHVFPGTVVEP